MKTTTRKATPLVLTTVLAALLLVACPPPNGVHPKTAPAAPSNMNAIAQSSSSIQVVWSDNSKNEDNFVLEYDTIAEFNGKVEISLPKDTTDKLVEGLDASTKHYFRVKAVNEVGSSAYSNVGEATTQAPPLQAPAAPSGLTATAASSSSIQTDWADNSDNEDNFVIACSKTADFAASTEATLPANTTSYLVGSLDAETKYYLRVRATNGAGDSAWSDTAEATTLGIIQGTMVINGGVTYTNSTNVTINSNIAAAAQMRFQNAGGAWSSWVPYNANIGWALPSGDGTKTVNGEFQDAVGTVLAKSDSIILDTAPPAVPWLSINNGATYATSISVTLSWTANDATQMRFQNAQAVWSAWEPYAGSKAWILLSGDGPKTVYAEFKDAAGNSRIVSDSITLDTQAPIVVYFRINDGASSTWTTSVMLNMAVADAVWMRFQNAGGSWSSWQSYQASWSWTITAGEDTYRYVYAEFADAAGNVVQVYDSIYYDAIRTLKFTAQSISFDAGADGIPSLGEYFWNFYGYDTSDQKFVIYNQPAYKTLPEGMYDFNDVSVTRAMSNVPGETYRILFQIFEDDGAGGVGHSNEVSIVYKADAGWGIGNNSIYADSASIILNWPSGRMYFNIEFVN
jgi:hypothetical protein